MKKTIISFIGTGNMATSLIKGLLADGYPAKNIYATNTRLESMDSLQDLNINLTTENRHAARVANIIILAVKPPIIKKVSFEISDLIQEKKPLLISIAVSVTLKTIQNYLSNYGVSIVRAMPNTPALLGCGATALMPNEFCSAFQKNAAEVIFRSVGTVIWAKKEEQLDVVAALSGSGPAYFFLFLEALQEVGVELGLSKEDSNLLVLQTALGAVRMSIESTQTIGQLIKNVASSGGITESALKFLNQSGFSQLIKEAVKAGRERAIELSKQF